MERKIKVLFTIPNFDTAGSGHVVYSLATGLDKNIFEVEICTTSEKGERFQMMKQSGIKVHVFNYLTPWEISFRFIRGVWKTRIFFKQLNPDIIHSYHYASEFSEAMAARAAGLKWLFTKKNMAWGNKAWKIRSFLANRIIATNEVIKKMFYNNHPKVSVIYSSVNTQVFPFQDQSLTSNNFIVVGNIIPIKGSALILEAFLTYAQTGKGNLYFVGDDSGSYANDLKNTLLHHKLKERVVFTGKTSQVKNFMQDAFCLIMASDKKGEGGPVALLEAMSSGLLVIGSKVPGISEQLLNFPELLFAPNSTQALLEKMHHVADLSLEQRESIAKELRLEIEKRFTLEMEIENHQEVYKLIAGK